MDNRKLLLLPGLLNGADLFEHQAEALADVGAVAIGDLTGSDSVAALADDVLAQAPDGQFVLAGMSMGGYVAFEIMRRAPQRVRGLVLMSTSARPDTAESTANREQLIAQSETDFPGVVEKLLAKMAHPDDANTPEVGGVFQQMAAALGRDVFVRQERAIMGRPDSRPTLAAIRCPTLVVCGRDDVVTPPDINREIAEGIAGARFEILDDCGHLLPLEQPERLTQILREWLCALYGLPHPDASVPESRKSPVS